MVVPLRNVFPEKGLDRGRTARVYVAEQLFLDLVIHTESEERAVEICLIEALRGVAMKQGLVVFYGAVRQMNFVWCQIQVVKLLLRA